MIKDLPEKLKLLRVKYGYSQKQVADKVNISPSIISGYETGERPARMYYCLYLTFIIAAWIICLENRMPSLQ